MKGVTFRRLPVIVGATLIAGMAAWTGVTHTSFFGQLVASGTTYCSGTLPPGTYGNVVVRSGQTCTINSSDIIRGDVGVASNATLHDLGSSVGGNLGATTGSHVFISPSGGYSGTNASIGHDLGTFQANQVSITQTRVGGDMAITYSQASGSVSITNNTIRGDLFVVNNHGPTTVTGNHVGGNARCSNNTAFVGGGNTAGGSNTCN